MPFYSHQLRVLKTGFLKFVSLKCKSAAFYSTIAFPYIASPIYFFNPLNVRASFPSATRNTIRKRLQAERTFT